MPPAPNAVKLKDLVRLREPIELPNGRTAKVHPFTFRMREMAIAIDAMPEGPEQDAKILELVRLCVPDMTDTEAGDLAPEQALAVIGIAAGQLESVLATIAAARGETSETETATSGTAGGDTAGNAEAPAAETVATPAVVDEEPAPARGSRRRSPPTTTSNT